MEYYKDCLEKHILKRNPNKLMSVIEKLLLKSENGLILKYWPQVNIVNIGDKLR